MKDERPYNLPRTALQERIAALLEDFYAEEPDAAVIACYQEGKTLNVTVRGSRGNIANALHSMLMASEDFYRIAVDVVGTEVARRMPGIEKEKLVKGLKLPPGKGQPGKKKAS